MQRPSRKTDIASQLLADSEPLDAQEQQAVISALEGQLLQQTRAFKLGFGAIALIAGFFFAYSAYQQHLHPWQAKFTGELRPVTSQTSVAVVLLCQGLGLLAAHVGLITELPKRWERERACLPASFRVKLLLQAGIALTAIGFVYWSSALLAMLQKYGPEVGLKLELLWLPLCPFGYCVLCYYVVHSLQDTCKEMQQLKRLQYDYKKV